MKIILLSLSFLAAFGTSAVAIVYHNDLEIFENPFGSTGQAISLTKSIPMGEGLFLISIDYLEPNQFQFGYSGIAEEYSLFEVTSGLEFTDSYVSSHTPLVTNAAGGPGVGSIRLSLDSTTSDETFLAYWDDRNFDDEAGAGDIFGWALFRREDDHLHIVEGLSVLGSGVVVGTIPEASVLSILIPLSVSWIALLRRRQSSQH